MRLIKSLAVSAIALTMAGQAVAGGFAPVVDAPAPAPVVIAEPEAPRSSIGIILPLALLAGLVAVALANDDDETD